MAVSTTGTATAGQSTTRRARQPRIRWASRISAALRTVPGIRLRAAPIAAPVRASAGGRASTSSCGWLTRVRGATASIAAAMPSPVARPKTSASRVSGPPIAGMAPGRRNST